MKDSVLIAIPVYNERQHVDRVLHEVRRYAPNILCVDDGSTDGTGEILEGRRDIRLIRHATNLGYGKSLIDAFSYAGANGFEWVVTMDCDEQHEPARIPAFLEKIEEGEWDLISGSRYLSPRGSDDLPPADRRRINRAVTEVMNVMFGWQLTDAFCGFKAHRTGAMNELRLDETGYAFPLQLWPRVAAAKLRMTEIPVRLIYNDPNRSFGGDLDDAFIRMRHYLDVLHRELHRQPERVLAPAECSGCFCPSSVVAGAAAGGA